MLLSYVRKINSALLYSTLRVNILLIIRHHTLYFHFDLLQTNIKNADLSNICTQGFDTTHVGGGGGGGGGTYVFKVIKEQHGISLCILFFLLWETGCC